MPYLSLLVPWKRRYFCNKQKMTHEFRRRWKAWQSYLYHSSLWRRFTWPIINIFRYDQLCMRGGPQHFRLESASKIEKNCCINFGISMLVSVFLSPKNLNILHENFALQVEFYRPSAKFKILLSSGHCPRLLHHIFGMFGIIAKFKLPIFILLHPRIGQIQLPIFLDL